MHDRNQKVASCLSRVKEAIVAVLLLMVVGTGTVLAQQSGKTITGKVLDENNQPMPGVTIIVDGTTNGTMTGPDGSHLGESRPEPLSSCLVLVTPIRFFLRVNQIMS